MNILMKMEVSKVTCAKYQLDDRETILKLSAEEIVLSIHRRNELVKLFLKIHTIIHVFARFLSEKNSLLQGNLQLQVFSILWFLLLLFFVGFFFCFIHFVFCRQHKHL